MKVVFHVDEMVKWTEATANIINLLRATDDIQIVLLVNGIAIKGFLDTEQQILKNSKVAFHACRNAMRAHNIEEADLPTNVIVVPAGVLDLVELQTEGYAYIKP
ncbi:DsrE family protein [Enterococcus mediterraneensis]|uniref:DsrE family protein n=1 Tax=Enterococcus TaxID=1350 RepID=UPI000F06D068|nr:DsrE family protein [Enterococcus mediterraneensis]